jgi:hypothetical protein
MNDKYNELEVAMNLYENGLQNMNSIGNELRLVAIYIRRVLDLKPKQLREQMYGYAEKYIIGYKREKYYPIINRAINNATKKGSCLISIESIPMFQNELDYINSVEIESEHEYECRKLMFTILTKMKLNKEIFNIRNTDEDKSCSGKYFKGGQRKYNELKRQAKIPDKIKLNEELFHDLYRSKLVEPKYNGLIEFKFIDEINKLESSEEIISINQFDDIGWYYDLYMGDTKIKICEVCGKLIKIKSKHDGSSKYCEKCAYIVNLEKQKERDLKKKL